MTGDVPREAAQGEMRWEMQSAPYYAEADE